MESQWDMLEKLLKEFDFTFAIHNYAIGFQADYFGAAYPYGNPGETAKKLDAQRRDRRMGICFDTGLLRAQASTSWKSPAPARTVSAACTSRMADPAHATTLKQLKARIAELRSEAN